MRRGMLECRQGMRTDKWKLLVVRLSGRNSTLDDALLRSREANGALRTYFVNSFNRLWYSPVSLTMLDRGSGRAMMMPAWYLKSAR